MDRKQQHFLVVAFPVQSHINPSLHLANRLALMTDSYVTFSTGISAHCRMFPDATSQEQSAQVCDGNLTFVPYPDGCDTDGFSSVITDLAARGRRVTCVIYTLLLSFAAEAAIKLSIPCAQYWIQPATTFVSYYHYFHGYDSLIDAHNKEPLFTLELPGLRQMQIRELPSFIVDPMLDGPYSFIFPTFKKCFQVLDKYETNLRPKILVNTFDELEPSALGAIDGLNLIAVGPILPPPCVFEKDKSTSKFDLFKPDEKPYVEWLDSKQERSVVYISFGSILVVKKQQMDEILKGLKASGKSYLWVVRKDGRQEELELERDGEDGMIVEWCSQVDVLSHPSVGCFLTHCGWNSTIESLVCGVPTVGVPQWTDQGTNVMLMEKEWGTGLRMEVNEEGVFESEELIRCLDLVMGDGERAKKIQKEAEEWKARAREAVSEGGSSDRNLRGFVQELEKYN